MQDFTKGNTTRLLILFALPMFLSNIFQQFYNMTDALIIGQFRGGHGLAVVGTCGPLMNFFLAALTGLTSGSSVVISQLFGAKREDELKRSVSTSILFIGGLALVVSVLGAVFTPALLRMMNTPEELMADAVIYLRIIMIGMFFPAMYNMYIAYMRALGDAKMPLYFLIASTILNVLLDIWFLAGLKLGVAANAFSTVLAQALAALACYIRVNRSMDLLKTKKLFFDKEQMKLILKYGLPSAIQTSIITFAGLLIMRLVNSFGALSIAGYTAANKIDGFATMPINNIGTALSLFVAQNMGAGREDRAKDGLKTARLLMLGFSLIISAVAFLFGKQLIALFVAKTDPNYAEIVGIGIKYLTTIVSFYFLFSFYFAFNGFFRGVGDAIVSMGMSIASLAIRTASAYLLASLFLMGPEAIAWSIPLGWGSLTLFGWWYYRKRKWAGKMAIKAPANPEPEAAE